MAKKGLHPEWHTEAKVICNGEEVLTTSGTQDSYTGARHRGAMHVALALPLVLLLRCHSHALVLRTAYNRIAACACGMWEPSSPAAWWGRRMGGPGAAAPGSAAACR